MNPLQKGKVMEFTAKIVIDVNELDLNTEENDYLYSFYEVNNDSYKRFFTISDYMDKKIHEKICNSLVEEGVIEKNYLKNPYFYVLLHFDW